MQDLWADFASEATSTEVSGRGGGPRQRRPNEQAVLTTLRAWLLQEYMLSYGTSLGATRIFQRCYWIDGLGNMRTSNQAMPAPEEAEATGKRVRKKAPKPAPILPPALQPAAAIARQLARLERPIALHSFVLDGKGGKRNAAGRSPQAQDGTQAAGTITLPKEGGMLSSTWSELALALLSTLEQSAAVFLLNPLKDGLFRYTDLLPLYQRTAPTELFLWLSHKQIEARLLPSLKTAEGAAALTNVLRSDRWKSQLMPENGLENPELVISKLIELFAESMRPHFLRVQRLTFPMHTGPALVEEVPYSLLFATRRQDSLHSLNDAVCCRARRLLTESQQGVLNETWFIAQREEQAAARQQLLYQEALSLGQTHRVRRWPDLRQQLLLTHFGQFTLQEYDQAITTLLARGSVRCDWRKRGLETTEARIPGNDDLLFWHNPG